jgi:sugar phosphate isomerase/epimerase
MITMIKYFLSITILLVLGLTSFAQIKSSKVGGIALYTLREEMKVDAKKTLREVANMGYAYVEASGYENGEYYGMSPEEFKSFMSEIGLEPRSTHQATVSLDNVDTLIQDAKAAGFKYFVIPIPPMGHFKKVSSDPLVMSMSTQIEEVTDIINTIGKKCNEAGLQLLYHNHNFEFIENEKGVMPIDYFLTHTDPNEVNFEMDLYWVTKAGADPIAYMNKYPGRFKAWHLKDMDSLGRFAPVGTGSIDFKSILTNKSVSGMDSYFVEQDATFTETPMESIQMSHDAIKEIGFE